MCGNVGLFGVLGEVDKAMFRSLLLVDTARGKHGTGIVSIKPSFDYSWFKAAGTPGLLYIQDEAYLQASPSSYVPFFDPTGLVAGESICLIGHNRHATVGKIATNTAHPFDFDNVIGVHNGTLKLHNCDLDYKKDYEVDSQVLYANIDKSSVPEVYSRTSGAMACIMWDKRDNTLNIWRNQERTLFVLKSILGDRILWASEEWMIWDTIFSHGQTNLWEDKVKSFVPDSLYTLTLEEGKVAYRSTKMEEKKTYTTNFTQTRGPSTGTARTTKFPPQSAKGVCTYGKVHADTNLGYFTWNAESQVFCYVPFVNNKLNIPDVTKLPDGMVCVWETTTDEHEYYFPLTGAVTPEMLTNFTPEPLLLENKGSTNDTPVVKLDMGGDDAKYITSQIASVPSRKGDLEPDDWIRVFVDKDKRGKPLHLAFRFQEVTYIIEKSLFPYVVYSCGNFWVTRTPTLKGVPMDLKRSNIEHRFRSYDGVGYTQTSSQLFDDMEKTDGYEVDGEILDFGEMQTLIEQSGGGCFCCSSVPLASEYSTLTWTTKGDHYFDYNFLCESCAPYAEQLKLKKVS